MFKKIKLTSTDLKILASFFMVIDHIAVFISNSPFYFHWFGRLSAPIFIYCMTTSIDKTRNIKYYLFRLYIASVLMGFIQLLFSSVLDIVYLENNFFRSLFCCCTLILILKNQNLKHLVIYLAYQMITTIFIILILQKGNLSLSFYTHLLPAILGNIFNLEGGLIFLSLGVIFYFTKNNKIKFSMSYSLFCIFLFLITQFNIAPRVVNRLDRNLSYIVSYVFDNIIGLNSIYFVESSLSAVFLQNCQWMMIFALPLINLYNGERGRSIKTFFYIFYPLHIIVLILFDLYTS